MSRSVVIIKPGRQPWRALLAESWHFRELLGMLVWRDIVARYKQTLFGISWGVLQPFAAMVVFSIFFGSFANLPSEGLPYPVFVYAGLLPWNFFAAVLRSGATSVVDSAALIGKVYFPRVLIPLSRVLVELFDMVLSLVVFGGLLLFYEVPLTGNILYLPVMILLLVILSLGLALLLAAWHVIIRDIQYVVPLVVQLWLFVSPVIYPVSLVPEQWQWLLRLNPLAGVIAGFRLALLNVPLVWADIGVAAAAAVLILGVGVWWFRRMEYRFADVL